MADGFTVRIGRITTKTCEPDIIKIAKELEIDPSLIRTLINIAYIKVANDEFLFNMQFSFAFFGITGFPEWPTVYTPQELEKGGFLVTEELMENGLTFLREDDNYEITTLSKEILTKLSIASKNRQEVS